MEKDYLQEIFLLIIYRHVDALVFKGGTCLYKLYKLDRFSEDLDFSINKEFDLENFIPVLKSGLEKFGVVTREVISKKADHSLLTRWRVTGPLFTGDSWSMCTIRLDINTKSEVRKTVTLGFSSLYPDIPAFDIMAMAPEEILAEKIRAIMSRTKARDVYDLWFLLQKGIKADYGLIEEKLKYYEQTYSSPEFEKHLHLKKHIWDIELSPFLPNVPSFSDVNKLIMQKMQAVSGKK